MSVGACRTSGISQRMLMLRLPVAMMLMLRLLVVILPLFSNGLRN